jgi:thioredoxin reductase (NADPH)
MTSEAAPPSDATHATDATEATDAPQATHTSKQPVRTDVLIVGAGPVGLFAAFEAGVIGLSCQIVDTLEQVGGQCIELYPDKPIYDIPAIPSCTARELVERLLEQCRPFDVPIHLGQRVNTVEQRADGRWTVTTREGLEFDAAAILLAAGNGAFAPQRLVLEEAVPLEGRHVHYSVRNLDDFAGKTVVVAGGGDSALDWALALRTVAGKLTLVHRRNGFSAVDSSVEKMRRAVEAGEMTFMVGAIAGLNAPEGKLESLEIRQVGGATQIEAEHVVALHAGRIDVDTSNYESSRPGIFAVGDIANYPNKQKLILSGFHEASLALRKAYTYAYPEQKRVHVHSSYDAKLAARVAASAE